MLNFNPVIKLLCNNSIISEPEWRWLKPVPFVKGLKRFSLAPAKGKRCCWFSTANTSSNCPSVLHQLKTPTFKLFPPTNTHQWPVTPSVTEQWAGCAVAMLLPTGSNVPQTQTSFQKETHRLQLPDPWNLEKKTKSPAHLKTLGLQTLRDPFCKGCKKGHLPARWQPPLHTRGRLLKGPKFLPPLSHSFQSGSRRDTALLYSTHLILTSALLLQSHCWLSRFRYWEESLKINSGKAARPSSGCLQSLS